MRKFTAITSLTQNTQINIRAYALKKLLTKVSSIMFLLIIAGAFSHFPCKRALQLVSHQ